MIQKFKLLGAVAGITFAGAMAASAATFSVDGGTDPAFPPAVRRSGDYYASHCRRPFRPNVQCFLRRRALA